MEKHKIYYKGEGGGFPQVQVVMSLVSPNLLVVSLVSSSLLVVSLNTKTISTMH
jgi:hypothetical protein